jgi:hypothetical protein
LKQSRAGAASIDRPSDAWSIMNSDPLAHAWGEQATG